MIKYNLKEKNRQKKYNYKLIIGFIIGMFLLAGSSYAAINYSADMFYYNNSTSTLNATNVQSAITKLAQKYANAIVVDGKICDKELPSFITSGAVMDNVSSTYVSNTNGIQFNAVSSNTNGKGIYIKSDTKNDLFPIYYYRGAVTNNNVLFGNFCWKIVRTTSTGGIKLIYNGVPSGNQCNNSTGTNTQLETTTKFSASTMSLSYVGYMYGTIYNYNNRTSANLASSYKYGNSFYYDGTNYKLMGTINSTGTWTTDYANLNNNHYTCFNTTGVCSSLYYIFYTVSGSTGARYITLTDGKDVKQVMDEMLSSSSNTTSGTMKSVIDNWYMNNLSDYTNYLEDTIWCSDRSIYKLNGWNPNNGDMSVYLAFGGYGRAYYSYLPSTDCKNKNDSFTVSSDNGNGKLTYPVGLITIDEAVLAGGKIGGVNNSYYLYTNQIFWLISPYQFSNAMVSRIDASGRINSSSVAPTASGVRPSISLKSGGTWSGDGTANNPYQVTYN